MVNQLSQHIIYNEQVITVLGVKGVHHLWYLVSSTLFAKGLSKMPISFKVSHPLIVDMIIFVNISKILN